MRRHSQVAGTKVDSRSGFTLIELLAVVAILAVLSGLLIPALAKQREDVDILQDRTNARQILLATALYASENENFLPHPTWGGGLTGPDGWAYLTSNRGRVPDSSLSAPPDCTGRDINSSQFEEQSKFFRAGQVGRYLKDAKAVWCPKDITTRQIPGPLQKNWLGRPVKVTSYSWNGTIGSYVGPKRDPNMGVAGKTYKASDFLPGDWQFWEENEISPSGIPPGFTFNDAGSNPESNGELCSMRHSGSKTWAADLAAGKLPPRNLPGGVIVGTFGGGALFVKWTMYWDIVNRRPPFRVPPTPLLCGPPYAQ